MSGLRPKHGPCQLMAGCGVFPMVRLVSSLPLPSPWPLLHPRCHPEAARGRPNEHRWTRCPPLPHCGPTRDMCQTGGLGRAAWRLYLPPRGRTATPPVSTSQGPAEVLQVPALQVLSHWSPGHLVTRPCHMPMPGQIRAQFFPMVGVKVTVPRGFSRCKKSSRRIRGGDITPMYVSIMVLCGVLALTPLTTEITPDSSTAPTPTPPGGWGPYMLWALGLSCTGGPGLLWHLHMILPAY